VHHSQRTSREKGGPANARLGDAERQAPTVPASTLDVCRREAWCEASLVSDAMGHMMPHHAFHACCVWAAALRRCRPWARARGGSSVQSSQASKERVTLLPAQTALHRPRRRHGAGREVAGEDTQRLPARPYSLAAAALLLPQQRRLRRCEHRLQAAARRQAQARTHSRSSAI